MGTFTERHATALVSLLPEAGVLSNTFGQP